MIDDDGRKEADALLEKMQAEVEDVYRTAQKDLQKKIDDYVGKFAKSDAKMQKLVADGKMSADDYEAWKKKTMLTGKQYRAMLDTVSADLTNADKIARSIINGYTPDVYAVGMNFGTYQVESGTTFNTSFSLYNRETVERLLRDDPQLLPMPKINVPKDKAWNYKHIKGAVTQGILQGESMPKIAKRLENVVGMDKNAAIRNARTAVTGAENAGRFDSYKRAQAMGIAIKKQWLATPDGRTRDSHVEIDLEVVELNENFSNGCEYPGDAGGDPAEVYNCRCAMIPWLDRLGDKFDGERAMNLHGMTYDEWKESHSRKVNVPVQQKVSDILRDAYENHREINNLNLSPANDFWGRMSFSGADLTGIDDVLKSSVEESLDDLTRRFDTPLIRVETMDAQESLMRQKTFASVHHNYEVDSATMKLNPVRFRDRDALVERLKELRQSGYIPAISDDKIDSYVVTHEFAHSLLGMQDPLNNARNFANANYGKIRSARKEIESIWKEYATSVGMIDEERKKMESAAILGDVGAWEKAKTLTEELRRVQISRYSLTNSDEFLAESFVAVELGDTENEFAIRAHSVMVKYFGR